MITGEDIGKRTIYFNPNIKKWEPCNWILEAVDSSMGYVYCVDLKTHRTFKWPIKMIIPIDTP